MNFDGVSSQVRQILEATLKGVEVSETQGEILLSADGKDLEAVMAVANELRLKVHGKRSSYVVTRNINFTNVCHMGCRFCGFGQHKDSQDAELLSMEELGRRVVEATERGATEVCIQGGLHPDLPGSYYRDIVKTVKQASPSIHLHAFSPFEIYYGARKSRMTYEDFLTDLKECGLGSIPGTAAEILDVEVRKILTKNKLSTESWVEIIKAAHRVGLPSTSTMMYGHVDGPSHWAAHLNLLRDIQKETGGFSEFVPLGFVHYESPLYLEDSRTRPGPTHREHIAIHAVARIMLHGYIDNIQASWVKLGPQLATQAQSFGVNDMGGTLMNESISRAAGALYGQEVTAPEMERMITSAGFEPWQRSTLYRPAEVSAPASVTTLKPRSQWQNEQIPVLEVV
ncbi:5-amino-6-(D-ribitylamino)uracil--L-tyrosine 4-hydroxyphenyl transferase CofH [Pseudomaricurvus sp.]|uniref:5-amino-6-(D-ribitylamino)uracil--L-tyrosine 4-hydroxyphenyl transferase CofH n=1 Tax=Pseudomaricurvus sp. TaxID=2004510 RepID=UPI003F6BB273